VNPLRLGDLTWQEAEDAIRRVDACVLPWGALEQHGPHLPLDTDAAIATALAERYATNSGPELELLLLPTLVYGRSPEHMTFAGTISLSFDALREVLHSVAESLAAHHVRHLLVINAHGGNSDALASQLREIRDRFQVIPMLFDIWRSKALRQRAPRGDWHAGRTERSLYAALVAKGRTGVGPDSTTPASTLSALASVAYPWRTEELTSTGAIGDPGEPDIAFGEEIVSALLDELAVGLSGALRLSSEETMS